MGIAPGELHIVVVLGVVVVLAVVLGIVDTALASSVDSGDLHSQTLAVELTVAAVALVVGMLTLAAIDVERSVY
jgi:hypothetical protein